MTKTKKYLSFKYQICGPKDRNYIKIVGFDNSTKHPVIPSHIEGFPVRTLGFALFAHRDIESVQMPDTLTKISPQAFAGCDSLKEISFPDSLKEIGYEVCCSCKHLEKVKWSKSAPIIYSSAFHFCNELKDITDIDSVEQISKNAFCKTGFTSFKIPPKLKRILYFAFSDCHNLKVFKMTHLPEMYPDVFWNSENVQIKCGGNESVKEWAKTEHMPIVESKLDEFLADIDIKKENENREK